MWGVPDEERGVILVRLLVECKVRREDARGIVGISHIVVGAGVAHGEVLAVPCPVEVKNPREKAKEEDHADQRVGNGVPAPHG